MRKNFYFGAAKLHKKQATSYRIDRRLNLHIPFESYVQHITFKPFTKHHAIKWQLTASLQAFARYEKQRHHPFHQKTCLYLHLLNQRYKSA